MTKSAICARSLEALRPRISVTEKSSTRGLIMSGIAVALTGCAAAPVGMERMSETMTARLMQPVREDVPEALPAMRVDLGFAAALRTAVEGNEAVLAAQAIARETLARVKIAESAKRLQVGGSSSLGGILERGSAQNETATGVAAGVNLSQLIYDGGETAANIDRATAEALGARAEVELRANDLALEAARAWIDVWQYQTRLKLLRGRTAEMNTVVGQIERMASNGMLDRAALDSARRQIVDIALEETRLKADLRQASVRFDRFFNHDPGMLPRPPELLSLAQARAQAGDWQLAPGLQRGAAELIVAQSAVAGAKAAFRPRARLQAGLNSPMQEGESTDTSVGLVVEYTFGDGGRRRAQLTSAEARLDAAETQLRDAQLSLVAELQVTLSQLAAIETSMPLVRQQMELSASEAETARSQLATGQSNLRQLIEAKVDNYRACDRHIMLEAERMALMLLIAARTGHLGRLIDLTDVATP